MDTQPATIIDKVARQEQLEEEMSAAGGKKFRDALLEARQKGRESETVYGSRLLAESIVRVSDGITSFLAESKAHAEAHGGAIHASIPYLEIVDPDVLALIATKGILDGITNAHNRVQSVALRIGTLVEDEVRFTHFEDSEQTDPKTGDKHSLKALFRTLKKNLDSQTSNYDHKKTVIVHSMGKAGVTWLAWPRRDKLILGTKLIELVIKNTGIAQTHVSVLGKKKAVYIGPTEEIEKWITQKCSWSESLCALYQPMIVPPTDWSGPIGGGYLAKRRSKLRLVKTRDRQYMEELFSADISTVCHAVNGMQRTPWRVNSQVLSVLAEAWRNGDQIGKLPDRQNPIKPTKPVDIETNLEARKLWKKTVSMAIKKSIQWTSKRLQISSIIVTAEKFVSEPEIYFPYNLDFRGRAYCVPSGMSPQGHDIGKSLLTFAHGKPLETQQAADWLAIHGANLYGFDKVSLQDRVQWIKQNEKHILQCAKTPLDYRWWEEADKPWQFLAFCFEWSGFTQEGLTFVSSLPIALDGSCNGLQHFSAMLRDPVGGAAVNLTPSDKPRDIYQAVADKTVEKLKRSSDPLATTWLAFGISRKDVKRCVMVVPYGGTKHSSRNYLLESVKKRIEEEHERDLFGDNKARFLACNFLAMLVWEAISETVVAARDAMGWLQRVSQVVAKEDKPLTWTAPSGFPVKQAYPETKSQSVETKMLGKVIKLKLADDIIGSIDKRRQAQGISPNFVHSLDAAALVFTVDSALDVGIESFGMVHDSYATLAADTDTLRECLRNSFCSMYQTDIIHAFGREIQAGLPDHVKLPELPPKGTLDINLVLQSDFFFA